MSDFEKWANKYPASVTKKSTGKTSSQPSNKDESAFSKWVKRQFDADAAREHEQKVNNSKIIRVAYNDAARNVYSNEPYGPDVSRIPTQGKQAQNTFERYDIQKRNIKQKQAVYDLAMSKLRIADAQAREKEAYKKYTELNSGGTIVRDPETGVQIIPEATQQAKSEWLKSKQSVRDAVDRLNRAKVDEVLYAPDYYQYSSAETVEDKSPSGQKYRYINDQGNEREAMRASAAVGGTGDPYEKYAYMNRDEVGIYNYLYNKHGAKAADNYLKFIDKDLNARQAEKAEKRIAESTVKYPGISDIGAIVASQAKGAGYLYALAQSAAGNQIDPNSPYFTPSLIRKTVSDTRSQQLTPTESFLYNTAMSIGEFGLTYAIAGPAGEAMVLGLMGTGAASDATRDALERGATDDQALLVGTLAGAAEIVFEKVSLENFVKMTSPTKKASVVLNALKQAGIEATEEMATEISNIMTDSILMGDLSEYKDMSAQDIAKQIGLAGLGGAISGGAIGSIGGGVGNYRASRYGRQLNNIGATDTILNRSLQMPENSEAGKMARELQQKGEIGNREAGYLASAYQSDGGDMNVVQDAAIEHVKSAMRKSNAPVIAQAYNMNTGSDTEITGIYEVSDKSVYVTTSDGDIVPLDDLELENANLSGLLNSAAYFDTQAAKTYISSYDGNTDIKTYFSGFSEVYNQAKNGKTLSEIRKNNLYAKQIPGTAQQAAYFAGRNVIEQAKPGVLRRDTDRRLDRKGKMQVALLDGLGKKYGVVIELVDTIDLIDGKKVKHNALNGEYDPETGHIRISKQADSKAYLYIGVHELIHYLKDKHESGYDQIVDAVKSGLVNAGYDVDTLVRLQMDKYKYDAESALEEVIANSAPAILGDASVVRRIVETQPKLAQRIAEFLQDFVDSMKGILNEMSGREDWAQIRELSESVESMQEIATAFFNALEDVKKQDSPIQSDSNAKSKYSIKPNFAAEYDAVDKKVPIENLSRPVNEIEPGKAVNFSTKDSQGRVLAGTVNGSAVKFSYKTWTKEEADAVMKSLVKAGFGSRRASKWIKDVNGIAAMIGADRIRLDYEAADNQVMLKPNAEYVKTLDASTLCAKRLIYQGTFNAIQHRLPNTVITSDMLIDLRNMLAEAGYESPCGICYVESRRRHLGKFAQEWLDTYTGTYKPTLDEVTTTDGLEALRSTHPDTYRDFVAAMNKKGSNNPKVVQLRTEYRGDIRKLTKSEIKKIRKIGGLRIQSFSDFETPHLIDVMQAVLDMTAMGLTSQAYTKVPNFAWVFGDTGIKINLSLIADGNGFDADGNLAFSSTEGMDFDEAMKLRNRYSKNVGTVVVGISDAHILACMADDRIDFIIPFHKSGWGQNELEQIAGLAYYSDYTEFQNEREIIGTYKNGKPIYKTVSENLSPVEYWDYNKSGKENAENYLKLCAKYGRVPKFNNFLVENSDGSYSLQPDGSTDGYWKLIIDYKMYDNNGKGAPQQSVTPDFNMSEAERVLSEYEGGANTLPVASDVADAFVQKHFGKKHSHKDSADIESYSEQQPRSVGSQATISGSKENNRNNRFERDGRGDYGETSETARKLKYSHKDGTEVDVKALTAENKKLKEANALLKEQFTLTKGHHVKRANLDTLAGRILRRTKSKYSKEQLVSDLTTLYDYIANEESPIWDEVQAYGVNMARAVLEQSQERNTAWYDETADIRNYLRTTPIKLTESQIQEVESLFESTNEFRKRLFGKVNISQRNGVALDAAWAEMDAVYPGLFDQDISASDMPVALFNAVNAMYDRPIVNPYGYDMDSAAYDLFLEINDTYFDLPEVKTFADKKANELARVKREYRNKISELRKDSKSRYADMVKELQAKFSQSKSKLISDKNAKLIEALAVQRQRYENRSAKLRETQTANKYKKRIHATASTLYQWMAHPTEGKYVPESLRGVVNGVLQTLDFAGVRKDATQQALLWRERLMHLSSYIERLDAADVRGEEVDAYLSIGSEYAERVQAFLDNSQEVREVNQLDTEQLKELSYLLEILKKAVQEVNTIVMNGKRQQISEYGNRAIAEADAKGITPYARITRSAIGRLIASRNIKPIYFFKNLGGSMQELFDGIRQGQNEYAFRLAQAKAVYDAAYDKYHASKWLHKQNDTLSFRSERGDLIELTREQALSLYATAKREAANADQEVSHLSLGGFVYESEQKQKRTVDENGKRRKQITFKDATPKPLSATDMSKVNGWLTDEQKAFADSLVGYMSGPLAQFGNETSIQHSGFKRFLEPYYFPYKSDRNYLMTEPGRNEDKQRWKHKGFTKSTVAGAKNPIVLQDFTRVFATHVHEMLMYSTMSIPQENLLRVFNYKTPVTTDSTGQSVKTSIENAYGAAAKEYINTFLSDLNGGLVTDPREDISGMMVSKFKKGAVLASLSVAIQQPSAIVRAMALVNPKYFISAPARGAYAEAKKYAGTAIIKDIGGFDTGTGTSAVDWLLSESPDGLKGKAAAFISLKDSGYRDSLLGWLPKKADEVAWAQIWTAVKKETEARTKLRGEELLREAGKRFDEVIEYTQVYDSVISRSDIMRSNGSAAKMATAFMAEPTTAYNMLFDAIMHSRQTGYSGKISIARATGAFVGSVVLNALLKSIVYAARDDDKDKTYLEKYAQSVAESLIGKPLSKVPVIGRYLYVTGDLSPLQFIPYSKDIISIFQGYDLERADMTLFADIANSLDQMDSETKTPYQKWSGLISSIAAFFGIPIRNVMRDVTAAYQTAEQAFAGQNKVYGKSILYAVGSGIGLTDYDSTLKRYIAAMDDGDLEYAQYLHDMMHAEKVQELTRNGAYTGPDSVSAAANNAIDASVAKVLETRPIIAEAYRYREATDTGSLKKLYADLEAHGYTKNSITRAINQYANALNKEPTETEYNVQSMYSKADLFRAIRGGSTDDIQTIKEDIIAHSDAATPEESLIHSVKSEFADDLLKYYENGDTKAYRKLSNILKENFDLTQDELDGWMVSGKNKQLSDALQQIDTSTASTYIGDLKKLGAQEKDIKSNITRTMKPLIRESQNDTGLYNQYASMLGKLPLYDKDGNRYYTSERIRGWLD